MAADLLLHVLDVLAGGFGKGKAFAGRQGVAALLFTGRAAGGNRFAYGDGERSQRGAIR